MKLISKNKLIVFIPSLILLFSFSIYAVKEIDIDKQIDKYRNVLKSRYEDPIVLNSKLSEKEKKSWKGLKNRLILLREASKNLYDPTVSAFNTTKTESTNSESFTATSTQGSKEGNHSIKVIQLARADKIASKPFSPTKKFKGISFVIKSGDKTFKVDFTKGGTLLDLADAFNKPKNKVAKARTTKVDQDNEMLVISGMKKGSKNRIELIGNQKFFKKLGFIDRKIKKQKDRIYKFNGLYRDVLKGNYAIDKNILIVYPNSHIILTSPRPIRITRNSYLEVNTKIDKVDKKEIKKRVYDKKDKKKDTKEKLKHKIGSIEEVKVGRIKLYGEPLIGEIKKIKDKKKTEKTTDKQDQKEEIPIQYMAVLNDNNKEFIKKDIPKVKKWTTIKTRLDNTSIKKFNKFAIVNTLSDQNIYFKQIKIYNPSKSKKGYNYISEAQDARLLYNGVEVTRDKNNIDDLIRGITISLKSPSRVEEELKITWDYDKIVEQLQKFVDEYNNVMLYLKNTTFYKLRQTLIEFEKEEEKIDRMSYEEKQFNELSGKTFIGTMNNDFSAKNLRIKLRREITSTPYKRYEQKNIKFIFQIGFKNPDREGGREDSENLKAGYIYLDKKIIKHKLKTNFDNIKALFAHAKVGSLIKNNGIAVNMVTLINHYAKKSVRAKDGSLRIGIIEIKIKAVENRIKQLKRKFEVIKKRNMDKIIRLKAQLEKAENARIDGEERLKRLNFGNSNNR